jgi:hypothetical protein
MKVRLKLRLLFFSAPAGQPFAGQRSAQSHASPTFFSARSPSHSRTLPPTFLSRGSGGGGSSASLRTVYAPPTVIDLKLRVVVVDLRRRTVIIAVLCVVVLIAPSIWGRALAVPIEPRCPAVPSSLLSLT